MEEMNKNFKKTADPILVILILFVIVVGGLFYFQYKSSIDLKATKDFLKITIIEAVEHGVSADSLKQKYSISDSLNNKR